MPVIKPFCGIRYNLSKVRLEDVVAPPYDVIGPEQQDELYARHPPNVVRLILGREEDRYAAAASAFGEWQKGEILVRDPEPSMYVLHQRFLDEEGRPLVRRGFIGLCRLEEFEKGIVLPHEKTLSKPKEDRLRLFKATGANFSQVFGLYSDPWRETEEILGAPSAWLPDARVVFEGVENILWRVKDEGLLSSVAEVMREKQLLIADGHHRYETALTYRDWRRSGNPAHTGEELYNYVMMFFTNLEDEGLVIFPTHRVVHSLADFRREDFLAKLEDAFLIKAYESVDALQHALRSAGAAAFGMAVSGGESYYLLKLKPSVSAHQLVKDDLPAEVKALDVALLHHVVLRDMLGISMEAQEQKLNIRYVQGAELAFAEVRDGKGQAAFLLNPTRIEQVRAIAGAGHTMPQKSTFFYPKLLSGLVLNRMD